MGSWSSVLKIVQAANRRRSGRRRITNVKKKGKL